MMGLVPRHPQAHIITITTQIITHFATTASDMTTNNINNTNDLSDMMSDFNRASMSGHMPLDLELLSRGVFSADLKVLPNHLMVDREEVSPETFFLGLVQSGKISHELLWACFSTTGPLSDRRALLIALIRHCKQESLLEFSYGPGHEMLLPCSPLLEWAVGRLEVDEAAFRQHYELISSYAAGCRPVAATIHKSDGRAVNCVDYPKSIALLAQGATSVEVRFADNYTAGYWSGFLTDLTTKIKNCPRINADPVARAHTIDCAFEPFMHKHSPPICGHETAVAIKAILVGIWRARANWVRGMSDGTVESQSGVESQGISDWLTLKHVHEHKFSFADVKEGASNAYNTVVGYFRSEEGRQAGILYLAGMALYASMTHNKNLMRFVGVIALAACAITKDKFGALATVAAIVGFEVAPMVAEGLDTARVWTSAKYDEFRSRIWPEDDEAETERVDSQGFIEKVPSVMAIGMVMKTLFDGINDTSASILATRVYRGITGFERDLHGVQSFMNAFFRIVMSVVNWCLSMVGLKKFSTLGIDPYWGVEAFLREIDDFRVSQSSDLCLTPLVEVQLRDFMTRGNDLLASLSRLNRDATATGLTQRVIAAQAWIIKQRCDVAAKFKRNSGLRPVPVMITLTGAPGVGKTIFTHYLWPYLAAVNASSEEKLAYIKNPGAAIYSRNAGEKYFSGYGNQPIVIIDEMGAMREDPTGENTWTQLINFINMSPACLNMADVESKGKMFFNSKFVVATSNLPNFGGGVLGDGVRCTAAVYRRLKLTFVYSVKPDYRTEDTKNEVDLFKVRLDPTKLPEGKLSWDHVELYRMKDLATGALDATPITIEEFKALIQAEYDSNQVEYERMSNVQLQAFKDAYVNSGMRIDGDVLKALGIEDPAAAEALAVPGSFPSGASDTETEKPSDETKDVAGVPWWASRTVKIAAGAALFAAVTAASYYVYHTYFTTKEEEIAFEQQGEVYSSRARGSKVKLSAKREVDKVESHIGGRALEEVVGAIARTHLFEMFLDLDGERTRIGTIFAPYERMAIMPDHFRACICNLVRGINGSDQRDEGYVRFEGIPYTNPTTGELSQKKFSMHIKAFALDENCYRVGADWNDDIVAVRIPSMIVKSAMRRITFAEDMKEGAPFNGVYVSVTKAGRDTRDLEAVVRDDLKITTEGDQMARLHLEYKGKFQRGDCGGMILDTRNQGFILGMHVAGKSNLGKGFAAVISRRRFEEARDAFNRGSFKDSTIEDAHEAQRERVDSHGDFVTRFGDHSDLKVKVGTQASSTQLCESPVYGSLPIAPRTAPAMLSPKRGIDPMDNALWGYGQGGAWVPEDIFDLATHAMVAKVARNSRAPPPGTNFVASFEQAVMGIEGNPNAGSLSRTTSPGWPYMLMTPPGKKFKQLAFGKDEYDFSSKECSIVRGVVENNLRLIREGKRPFTLFRSFLKDEKRPFAKVESGNSRLISSAPLDATILMRMYTLTFTAWAMDNRIYNGCALGVNCHSDEWSMAARYLGEGAGYRVICGDFKGWDKKLGSQLMTSLLPLMDLFYGDSGSEASDVRRALIDDLMRSRHIDGGLVYEWSGSNPSGQGLTTPLNSFAQIVLFYAAIIVILRKHGYGDEEIFRALVSGDLRHLTYGDDGAWSMRRNTIFDVITAEELHQVFLDFGVQYTSADKKGIAQFETLAEASFLKRTFSKTCLFDKGRYMAPLELATIYESVQWTRKSDFCLTNWKDNVINMAYEASAHGEEEYVAYTRALAHAGLENGHMFAFPPFPMAQRRLVESEYLF